MTTRLPSVNRNSPRIRGNRSTDDLIDPMTEDNPFALPQEDVFMMREREKQAKIAERRRQKSLKIWEKGTHNSGDVLRGNRIGRITRRRGGSRQTKQDRMFQGHRREKENMAEFISKKREMFLIQMSLDTKREEIHKLEEKAAMKEEALKKSEMMLEEDALRFGEFLKENDQRAHEALKKADEEATQKQLKVAEIKKLNQEINKYENELSKCEDTLTRCMKYKDFLDKLAPPEFKAAKKKRKEERRARRITQGLPDNSDDDSSDDEMYFKHPDELLAMFTQLELRSLFLIENSQATEVAVEELKTKFEETKRTMDAKTSDLEANISDLKAKIAEEEAKAEALLKRTRANTFAGDQLQLLQGLRAQVDKVYDRVGFVSDQQADPIDQLRELEGWLEYLLNEIQYMDPDAVRKAEVEIKIKRRDERRIKQLAEDERLQEERLANSTRRAKKELVVTTGRQVMFRSPPIRKKKKKEEKQEKDDEKEQLISFFT